MEPILFVNACVRGEQSRTLRLARHFLKTYAALHPDEEIYERDLCARRLEPQYSEVLAERDRLWEAGKLSDPLFDEAHRFAEAHKIVVAAPFWDLNYPAILKIYLERISVCDITFGYDDAGQMKGLCQAGGLLLITTRGGDFSLPGSSWMEMGARHLEALCAMYGIGRFHLLAAEGLDDISLDAEALLHAAMERADALACQF